MMLKKEFLWCGVLASALMLGCTYPSSQVVSGGSRASVLVQGAENADIYLDGLKIGVVKHPAEAIFVNEGPHVLEVQRNGAVIYTEKVLLSIGESKNITVR